MIYENKIKIVPGLPDDKSVYSYVYIGGYQNDFLHTYTPIYCEQEFKTNTLRILELENVLIQYDEIYKKYFLMLILFRWNLLFRRDEIKEEFRDSILEEIKLLKRTSKYWGPEMEKYKSLLGEWICIDNGVEEAKLRFKESLSKVRKR